MSFLIQQTLIYAVPLMIVALAGVFAERSGIINLALEGIMIFGAFIGVLFVPQSPAALAALKTSRPCIWRTRWCCSSFASSPTRTRSTWPAVTRPAGS